MSFFGFDNQIDLESERRRFLEGEGQGQREDIAVYTWGEQGYDGLGNELQEGGDDLNDETFGASGQVGKDFDFSQSVLPSDGLPQAAPSRAQQAATQILEQPPSQPVQSSAPSRSTHSLESVWDDKSPFSVLGRMSGASRATEQHHASHTPSQSQSFKFSPFGSTSNDALPASQTSGGMSSGLAKGAYTLEEVEAEMRAKAALQHQQQQQQQQLHIAQPSSLTQAQLRGQIPRQGTPQHAASPPPRMHPHSQSPRFHQQQQQHQIHLMHIHQQQQERQLLELSRQRERQKLLQEQQLLQQQQQQQIMEQLRLEEIERARQIRLQQMQSANHLHSPLLHQRQSPALSDRHPRSIGRQSPAMVAGVGGLGGAPVDVPFQQSMSYLPQDIQLQQRLLAEMAQAEFLNSMQGGPQSEREIREEREMQEILRAEAMRKIMEAERSDQKRRRKQAKIQHMSRYNDLMTQSDKDFITRIQVSQLVTQDPYADDFYAQVYGALIRSRMGVQTQDDRILKFGSGVGVGLGPGQKGSGRRPSAMQRMEAQVERIVNNAKMREKEKITLNSLQGALGKTSGRSYKAAPRQLLQVDSSSSPTPSPAHAHISKSDVEPRKDGLSAAHEAAKIGHQALGGAANSEGVIAKDPLTHREALMILERLYDLVLDIEQLRRDQPSPEDDPEAQEAWEIELSARVEQLSNGLRLNVYLETSVPHPFISLLMPIKGKRLLPRVARHLPSERLLIMLSLIIACFYQLDVVIESPMLDTLEETEERTESEHHSQVFLSSLVQSVLPAIGKLGLDMLTGLLGMLFKYNDVAAVARTPAGIALLTMFLSRVQNIKEAISSTPMAISEPELPTPEDERRWQEVFDELFNVLAPGLLLLFPSIRISKNSGGIPYGKVPGTDDIDQPVWQFLAAMAVHSSMEQQQYLVTALRELVLENVSSVRRGFVASEEEREKRLSNLSNCCVI
ncbi:topoisomerase II-associated protein PAT1 [Fomitopsis serialis]|uniref:topoisomerase II-associated protein PAT1 n=1 Tax=Fomitopsis serialis TaxID=139415 RepID=UPI0020081F1B|nr:topoisomerase II-associated protein PAT1 [Neoantrodia serialis]KAH9924797.1 topoisomerase II-associated protein PAT1 [Neoantrodia serialis]